MSAVSKILSLLLVLVCVASAVMDFRRPAHLLADMQRLRIPANKVPQLGVVKLVLAAGLLVGLKEVRVAEASAAALSAYFAVATLTHTRVKDSFRQTAPAFALLVVSVLCALTTFAG